MNLSNRDHWILMSIAGELADDRSLDMSSRELWCDIAVRIDGDSLTEEDRLMLASACRHEAGLQPDAKTAAHYMALVDTCCAGS